MHAKLVQFKRIATARGLLAALHLSADVLLRRARGLPRLPRQAQPADAPVPWGVARPPSWGGRAPSIAHLVETPAARPPPDTGLPVAVIMPVRNRPAMVAEAIRSVQAQTWPHWRLYVVDDASTDETPRVLAGFAAADARISVLTNTVRTRAATARNRALAACAADGAQAVAYLDSDNLYYPHYLAELARAYAADPALRCAYCATWWETPDSSWLCFEAFDPGALLDMRMNLDMNVFSHRPAFGLEAGGFDPLMVAHDDWDFILRCVHRAAPAPLPVLGVHYRAGRWPRITNMVPSGPNAYHVREKYAARDGVGRRVLLLPGEAAPPPAAECELRWLRSRGFEVRVHPAADEGGTLEQVLDDFRPHAVHAHDPALAARHAALLAARGVALTVRARGFEPGVAEAARLAEAAALTLFLLPEYAAQWPHAAAMTCCFDGSRRPQRVEKPASPRMALCIAACAPDQDLDLFFRVAARCPQYRFVAALTLSPAHPEQPHRLGELNAALGGAVELRFDPEPAQLSALLQDASVLLHTADLARPVDMPMQVAEAMAHGAVPLVRDHAALRALAGRSGVVYADEGEALACLRRMDFWDQAVWRIHANACVEYAFNHFVDTAVLTPLGRLLAAPRERAA